MVKFQTNISSIISAYFQERSAEDVPSSQSTAPCDEDLTDVQIMDVNLEEINVDDPYSREIKPEASFKRFRDLPKELRLMIWEFTWPHSRVIEVSCYSDEFSDDYDDLRGLRLGASLSTWLTKNTLDSRMANDQPFEPCPNPIALYINHESRTQTLKRYTMMEHITPNIGSFYFNAFQDVIWINTEAKDEANLLLELKHHYGSQLDNISLVMVEEFEWEAAGPETYYAEVLRGFAGLKTVFIVRDDEGDGVKSKERIHHALSKIADGYRADFARVRSRRGFAAQKIEHIDRGGNLY